MVDPTAVSKAHADKVYTVNIHSFNNRVVMEESSQCKPTRRHIKVGIQVKQATFEMAVLKRCLNLDLNEVKTTETGVNVKQSEGDIRSLVF